MYTGDEMKEKEEEILQEIINYVKKNKMMPTRRYLQKSFNYRSINSITRYIKSLEKQNYLIRNDDDKIILNNYSLLDNNIKTIKVINMENNCLLQ